MTTNAAPDIVTALTPSLTPGVWTIDSAHSLVEFVVRHMTIARVSGRFTSVSGQVAVTSEVPASAQVSASIDVASVASGHPKRDELIRSGEFLDAEHYPVMEFAATSGQPDITQWPLVGELTIKGVTRPVELQTQFHGVVQHRGATRAGFSATTTINRHDFGVSWKELLGTGGAIVSDTVRINLDIELVRAED